MNFSEIELEKILPFICREYRTTDEECKHDIIKCVSELTDEESICVYELYHSKIVNEFCDEDDDIIYNILLKRIRCIKLHRLHKSITSS